MCSLFTLSFLSSHPSVLHLTLIVFPDMLDFIPASLHVTVIFFCGVLLLFSSVATAFFMFNAFGSPYETLHGPLGLYLWTFVCCELHIMFRLVQPFSPAVSQRTSQMPTDQLL